MFESIQSRAIALLVSLTLVTGLAGASSTMSAAEALAKTRAGEITLIDIRTPSEWRQTGIADGALTIDMTRKTFVQEVLSAVDGDMNAPIVLICRTGNRTGYTLKALEKLGFTNVSHVAEGMAGSAAGPGWIRRGLPTESCRTC